MTLLPPATKLWQGNVFTPVCQSFCLQGGVCLWSRGGVCHTHPWADTPQEDTPGRHPLSSACWDTHTPAQYMLGYTSPCAVHAGIRSTSIPLECIHVVYVYPHGEAMLTMAHFSTSQVDWNIMQMKISHQCNIFKSSPVIIRPIISHDFLCDFLILQDYSQDALKIMYKKESS